MPDSSISRMKALVTGGAGFIGSHLVDRLVRDGHQVLVVDNLTSGNRGNLDQAVDSGATLQVADVTDGPALKNIFADFQPDTVFHLAAQIDVRNSMVNPGFDAMVNVVGTVNLLNQSCDHGVGRFIFMSTGGAIYGEGEGLDLPLSEGAGVGALSPYGHSKYAAETYLDFFMRPRGLKTLSLRPGNVYGPRQDAMGEAGVVAIFAGRILSGESLTVFGDGKQTRDYVYAEDVADACARAAVTECGGTVNIGTGRETSVLEIVEFLGKSSGKGPIDVSFEAGRDGEVRAMSLDSSRAEELLGWLPSVGIEEGLERTLLAMRS